MKGLWLSCWTPALRLGVEVSRSTIQNKSSQQDTVIKTPYQHKTVNIFVENVIVSLTNVDFAFLETHVCIHVGAWKHTLSFIDFDKSRMCEQGHQTMSQTLRAEGKCRVCDDK